MKIAVIDAHPVFLTGITHYLKGAVESVEIFTASSLQKLLGDYPAIAPDLLLLGVARDSYPQSLVCISQIKTSLPGTRLIIYDELTEPNHYLPYIQAGASGYLSKRSELVHLLECIHAIKAGKFYINPDLTQLLIHQATQTDTNTFRSRVLTRRQIEIANYLGEGIRTGVIANILGLSRSTISTVKSIIFFKLGINNIIQLREVLDEQNFQLRQKMALKSKSR